MACVSNWFCFSHHGVSGRPERLAKPVRAEIQQKVAVRNSHYFGVHAWEHIRISDLRKEVLKSAFLGKACPVSLVFINSLVNVLGVFFEQYVLCRSLTQTKSFPRSVSMSKTERDFCPEN